MKKTIYICDGCGKQADERTTRVKHRRSYGYSWTETKQVAPEGWSRVTVNRKGADICSAACAGPAIDNLEAQATEAAEKKAAKEREKVRKAAEKARAKANGTSAKKGARS